jgi:putative two-component system response regulator
VPLFQQTQPDIVLLDLMMPEMDGFEVMKQLRLLIPEDDYLPILVLTADSTVGTTRHALAAGARDFLTKPFDQAELSLRLWNMVEARYLHLQLHNQNHLLEQRVQERTHQLQEAEIKTLECLAAAAEYRDDDTGQHTQRVGHLSAQLASGLGLPETMVEAIRRAAPLHDVGKIGVSDLILLKPSKLTPEEFATMQQHTTIGASILSRHATPLLKQAANIALSHHERWSGGGYPHGLSGEEIPIEGRIVAVADVFDALTHARTYKKAWPVEDAIAEIERQSGQHFDPDIVHAFLSLPIMRNTDVAL